MCHLRARVFNKKAISQYVGFLNLCRQFEKFIVAFVVIKNKSLILLGNMDPQVGLEPTARVSYLVIKSHTFLVSIVGNLSANLLSGCVDDSRSAV